MQVRVQQAAFDPGAELAGFAVERRDIGAIVSFTGVVRDTSGDLRHMMIEHYPGMTERAITGILDQAVARWSLADALVIHRLGTGSTDHDGGHRRRPPGRGFCRR